MKNLDRFIEAQEKNYEDALSEIKKGKKTSHWMWYVFPQIAGLGHSDTAKFYAIEDLDEAKAFLNHPILGKRLVDISTALLIHQDKTAHEILGSPDDVKLHSSMTLFNHIDKENEIFSEVLAKYFDNKRDLNTTALLNK